MITAVGYIRVSSDEQAEEGFSLAAQERAIQLYCELHGMQLITCYVDDGYSGTNEDRPAFTRLLTAAELQTFQTVIVHKFDRWARNTELLLRTIRRFTDLHITFVSISEQIDCSTPAGKMMLTIIASTAQFHSDNLSVEVCKGIFEKVQQGKWHGPIPIGYQKGPDDILIASEDAPVVKLAFQLYASGQYSAKDLARKLNGDGHRVYNIQKRRHVLFDKWNILGILENKAYLGFAKYKNQLYPGKHAPLIDQTTWDTVQQIRAGRAAKRGKMSIRSAATGTGILTELVFCEHCGKRMHFHPSTSANNRRYGYYRCSGREKLTCDAGGVRSDKVDTQMRQIVGMIALPREWREEVLKRAEQLLHDAQAPASPERTELEQQLVVLEDAHKYGMIVGAAYAEKRHAIDARLAELATTPPEGPGIEELRAAAELLGNLPELLAAAPIPEQRGVLRSIFDSIWVTAHNVCAIMPNNKYYSFAYAALQSAGMVSRVGSAPRFL